MACAWLFGNPTYTSISRSVTSVQQFYGCECCECWTWIEDLQNFPNWCQNMDWTSVQTSTLPTNMWKDHQNQPITVTKLVLWEPTPQHQSPLPLWTYQRKILAQKEQMSWPDVCRPNWALPEMLKDGLSKDNLKGYLTPIENQHSFILIKTCSREDLVLHLVTDSRSTNLDM